MPLSERVPIANRLLSALSDKSYDLFLPLLEPVTLHFGEVLYEPGTRIRNVCFPNESLVSLLSGIESKRAAEVALVGSEGFIGLPIALGIANSSLHAVVQGTGTAMRIGVPGFQRAFENHPQLQQAVWQFTHALITQIAQTSPCNRFHLIGPGY